MHVVICLLRTVVDISKFKKNSRLLEKFKINLYEGGKAGAILMDLSKAFGCIRHDLLIAKLHAYGLSHKALTLINDYRTNGRQRVKVNGSFSSLKDLKTRCYSGVSFRPSVV